MLLYSVGALWVIEGQHGDAACDEICKDVTARMGEVEDSITTFDVCIIKFDTPPRSGETWLDNITGRNTMDVRAVYPNF